MGAIALPRPGSGFALLEFFADIVGVDLFQGGKVELVDPGFADITAQESCHHLGMAEQGFAGGVVLHGMGRAVGACFHAVRGIHPGPNVFRGRLTCINVRDGLNNPSRAFGILRPARRYVLSRKPPYE